ncbi:hypothetical protein NPIL_536331 [Nephila pilipes]|uniref:Uncharacterized protein n=1 Tax=Nephila pilipes TaxID=299642 RepID=A0A8X6N693_NEPPI|nr:hypothetical protein NPIL_536331 [Nephila pilipes]
MVRYHPKLLNGGKGIKLGKISPTLMHSKDEKEWGRAYRSPATKNCAPQATAVCGCGERQPTEVQWKASAREILLLDQG